MLFNQLSTEPFTHIDVAIDCFLEDVFIRNPRSLSLEYSVGKYEFNGLYFQVHQIIPLIHPGGRG